VTTCVILGGGLAGLLAAVALRSYATKVIVIERDRYPGAVCSRRGSPQSRHSHVLVGGGAWALEELLPGITRDLMKAGAQQIRLQQDAIIFASGGLVPAGRSSAYCMSCSKDLLDYSVRRRAGISVLEETTATGLIGDATGIRGVRVRDRFGDTTSIQSDIVVDAMGRSSRAAHWLSSVDIEIADECIASNLSAASRRYRLSGSPIPGIVVQPAFLRNPDYPSRGGTLFPIEGGQIMVTLTGALNDNPPGTNQEFISYSQTLQDRIISDAISCSEPVDKIYRHQRMPNTRRRFKKSLPGYIAIGDSLLAVAPNYSNGMAIAALSALGVQRHLQNQGNLVDLQSVISSVAEVSWQMATGGNRTIGRSQSELQPHSIHSLPLFRVFAAAQMAESLESQTLMGVAAALGMPARAQLIDSALSKSETHLKAFRSWLSLLASRRDSCNS